ncbi:MAG: magnesium/cobalt transporter CorA [Caldilineaceae bacterium]|nr:magnesium/cobalt transporter CorA [Caldilineaceae bacterium]MCB9161452.1 magnesium/cobalt transporter CorA [Caldilineaceae bacterium]MCB9162649.1 magnesium/cobalt transporter CorA [Caldilineaceae bacterium]
MIRSLYRHSSGTILQNLSPEQLRQAAVDRRGLLWVDMENPDDDEFELVLRAAFHFHPLAVEDVVSDVHVPKLDDYGSYLFIVFHTVTMGDESMDFDTDEIDTFLGGHFLVTIHTEPRQSLDRLWEEETERFREPTRTPSLVLYTLLDRQVDGYIPMIDLFEERLDELGDEIFLSNSHDDKVVLNELLTAKSSALRLRRVLYPQRELLSRLANQTYAPIPDDSRLYFRDVYDHVTRLADLAESTRDLATVTIETYLALVNNRMNEVMKVLTVIATIFMPLGFLASVYGMNFDYMPELHVRWAYPLVWALFLLTAGGMLTFFVRRRWL